MSFFFKLIKRTYNGLKAIKRRKVNIKEILSLESQSILIIEKRQVSDIVVGVPHHAPAGTSKLPCPEHTVSDENAGFLGRYIAEKLDCCSIIACNYTMDVNKHLGSDYAVQISLWYPRYLVEIHGHGGKITEAVEISCGSSEKSKDSKNLADKLSAKCEKSSGLKTIPVNGDFKNLKYKASHSATITTEKWFAYHIELPPLLRKPENISKGEPPETGYRFCDCLVECLRDLIKNNTN